VSLPPRDTGSAQRADPCPPVRDCTRLNAHGKLVFPHFDGHGLCGFELKNRDFTGFAAGGEKGLWVSNDSPRDRRLVFCESAIECLSHATLFPDPATRYASIGADRQQQLERLRALPPLMGTHDNKRDTPPRTMRHEIFHLSVR
jgi:hypothetical protein